jgi:hypothetical protein
LAECFSTCSAKVTWPSAAITTSPLRRTQITVVERIREGRAVVELFSKAKKNLLK